MVARGLGAPDNLHIFIRCTCASYVDVVLHEGSFGSGDMEMFDQVLYGSSSLTWHRCWYAGCWLGGFRVGWGGGCDNVLDSTLFMNHLHWRDIGVDTLCTCGVTRVDIFAYGSCTWSDIGVDTLCTCGGTWVDMFAYGSCSCIGVDTLCTCGGTWVDTFAYGSCTWRDIGADTLRTCGCGNLKTLINGLPNPQLFNLAYQYVWRKNNADKDLFQLLATELKNWG